jgi:glycosyl hydrolase family 30
VSRRCDTERVAFRNPDGRVVFVAANFPGRPVRFSLRRPDRKTVSYDLPPASPTEPSVVTRVWR